VECLLVRYERFDQGDHLRCIPFGRADQAANFATLSIDQDGRGQAKKTEGESSLARWIDVDVQVFDPELGIELVNDFRSAPIDRERNDFEVGTSKLCLQAIEGRHLGAARTAPRRPKIEQHDLTAEILKRPILARAIHEVELRQSDGVLWRTRFCSASAPAADESAMSVKTAITQNFMIDLRSAQIEVAR
jgi:hypothetical protein